jgi:MFS transporter, DHA2 family, multidrug resistance protein
MSTATTASPPTAIVGEIPQWPPAEISPRRILAFVALAFGMFMAILDIQIVASSLSEIQAGLSASSEEISWVQTAYLVAEVIMIPMSGYLGRLLSTRYLFALSAAGFTLMSVMCATSTSIEQMIVWRALQGFIGGGMIPSVFSAAYTIFPRNRQGGISAVIGLVATLAPTIGPTVGGYLTNTFSWHWLFLVNVVPGIAVTLAVLALVDFDEPDFSLLDKFDFPGVIFLAMFLGSLEYFLEEGPSNDWFADRAILLAGIAGVLGGVAFFARVLTAKNPIVDLRTFENRNFATGCVFAFAIGIGLYGLVYLYPVFLARVRAYDALQIGETMAVTGAAMMFSAPLIGRFARAMDPRLLIAFGLGLFALSCFELTPITKDWAFSELLVPQIMRGVALMACMVPVNIIALGTLPIDRLKNASGLFNLMRNLGGAVGLAVITTVLNDRWDLHLARLHEAVSWGSAVAEQRLATMTQAFSNRLGSDAEMAALRTLANMARREALVMAFSDVFLLLAVLFAALVLLVPLVQRPRPAGPPGGGH